MPRPSEERAMLNDLLSFWLLPSLFTWVAVVHVTRIDENRGIEKYDFSDWIFSIVFSVIYPLGLLYVFSYVWPWLIKER